MKDSKQISYPANDLAECLKAMRESIGIIERRFYKIHDEIECDMNKSDKANIVRSIQEIKNRLNQF